MTTINLGLLLRKASGCKLEHPEEPIMADFRFILEERAKYAQKKTRRIGPIPSIIKDPDENPDDVFYHPGGPQPKWGTHRPILALVSWSLFCNLTFEMKTIKMYDHIWSAHTSARPIEYTKEGWFFLVNSEDVSTQCVNIARDALREGVLEDKLLLLGITQREIDDAKK